MKPIIVGINNPHSDDPEKALGVEPVGSAGNRLWLMVKDAANRQGKDFREIDYLDGFDRVNLMEKPDYTPEQMRLRQYSLMASFTGRRVVMCGTKVPMTMGLRHSGFHLGVQQGPNFVYYVIPHPSGLCREYNDQSMRHRVGDLLFSLLRRK